MVCKKCGGTNVTIQAVAEFEKKRKGILYWLLIGWWFELIMWIFFTLPWLIIKIIKPDRVRSKMTKYAICQNCGHSWKV